MERLLPKKEMNDKETKNVNLASLKKTHGDDAENIFRQVAQIGGFGDVEPNNPGGLDITGLSESKQAHILKLVNPEPANTEPPKEDKADKKEGK
jgi:hypothetical protein